MGGGAAGDRISELHESLIHHIFSFLTIKCIVSTTVLSKRWNNLWASLPVLDFTQWRSPSTDDAHQDYNIRADFDSDTDEDSEQDEYRVVKDEPPVDLSETNRFMNFLDQVLFLENLGNIKKFSLKTDSILFDQGRVKRWIHSIIMRNVEELFLSIKCSGPRVVPIEVFTCESLTVLDLQFDNKQILEQPPSSNISFQRLKKLQLSFVEFKDETMAMQLFSNCPVLEDLRLSIMSWKGIDFICFALPQLKFFGIAGFAKVSIENVVVKFDTPNLVTLKWFDYLPKEFIVDSFPCLAEVGIQYNFANGYSKSRYDSLFEFTEKVSHVKHLIVSHTYFRPKILDDSSILPRSYHTFRNLVIFEVDVIYYGQIRLLFDMILQYTPNLTSLIIHQLFAYREVGEDGLLVNIVPQCLLQCLTSIEFQRFHGYPEEMEVVKLFLETARVLQSLTLGSSSDHLEYTNKKIPTMEEVADANAKILEKLHEFPWASADCVVKFLSP